MLSKTVTSKKCQVKEEISKMKLPCINLELNNVLPSFTFVFKVCKTKNICLEHLHFFDPEYHRYFEEQLLPMTVQLLPPSVIQYCPQQYSS